MQFAYHENMQSVKKKKDKYRTREHISRATAQMQDWVEHKYCRSELYINLRIDDARDMYELLQWQLHFYNNSFADISAAFK